MKKVNSYNCIERGTAFYHAIAKDEQRVIELAEEKGIDLSGLEIELERMNVRDEMGRPFSERIEDALVY